MNAAWPNDSSPVKPSSRLNAHAKMAKHSAFIMKTGYRPMNGAASRIANTTAHAMRALRVWVGVFTGVSLLFAEQAGRSDHQHDRHDHEDHDARRFRIED